MRAPTQVGRRPIGFNMTPMIDIVFLLLIFYLVSNTMERDQQEQGVNPPASAIGLPRDQEQGRRIVFNIFSDGRIRAAGSSVGREELFPLLETENRKAAGKLKVRIRGDRDVQYENVEPILLACARAGIWDVVFAVVQPQAR